MWIALVVVAVIVLIIVVGIIVSNDGGGSSRSNRNYRDRSSPRLPPSTGPTLTPEEYKGFYAERSIAIMLKEIADKIGGCYLINDVLIPSGKDRNGNQRTVEIDHILFTPSGLFVVETKSRAGTIYGAEEIDKWIQVLGWENEIEHEFFNPIKQNDIHIRALKRLLMKNDLTCYSCVVFEDGDISRIESEIVITPDELRNFVLDTAVDRKYSQGDLIGFYTRVQYYKDHPPKSKDEHIREIHRIHNDYDA